MTAPGGLTTYYDPLKGLGFSRRQEAVLNAYAQNINPFAGWTFGAYASEVKQFGVGEIKGAVNYSTDLATLGLVHDPLAAHGQNEQAGAETLPVIADTVQWVDGAGEVVALARLVRGGAAKFVAGAASRFARKGGNCFVAGTPVQMADGTTKPIEQIKVGDYVKSRNPQTGQTEAKRVTETFSHLAPQVLTLSLTDPQTGHAAEQITCTPGHPFYVDGKGFVLAGQLGIGTSIVTRAGPSLTLSTIAWSAAPASGNGLMLDGNNSATPGTRVYNFTVDGDHTYFVGTVGGGAWVHNDSLKVGYGSEELSQAAIDFRNSGGGNPTGTYNVAVFKLKGDPTLRPFRSFHNVGHSEQLGYEALKTEGYTAQDIEAVYSERHPCGPGNPMNPLPNCHAYLGRELPGVQIKYSFRTNAEHTAGISRALGSR